MQSGSSQQVLAVNSKLIEFLHAYGRKIPVVKGATFISEGDDSNNCFLLLDGRANILKTDEWGRKRIVAQIGTGSIVGELGVFLKMKRFTSVQAVTNLILLEFSADCFYKAVENTPELAMRIIKSLSERLNAANRNTVSN